MAINKNLKDGREREFTNKGGEGGSSIPNDLPDNKNDRDKLEPEEITFDLPDVKDIPGQEFIHVAPLGELADTTISSADEEGTNIIGLNDDDEIENETSGSGNNIGRTERAALADDSYMPTRDENNLRKARMDNVDFEGDPLNEGSFGTLQSDKDLDIPGSGDSTRIDSMAQSDEENKGYSVDDTDASEASENRSGL